MKKWWLIAFSLLFFSPVYAGLVDIYKTYNATDSVTNLDLNGNLNNIRSVVNGGLDNTNVNTVNGFRLYEVLGTLPLVGTQGRIVYYTPENSLNFDTGSLWVKAITIQSPTQGDTVYYNGTQWRVLPIGVNHTVLESQGANNNPIWSSSINTSLMGSGTADTTNWLRGDKTWVTPPGLSNHIFQWNGIDTGTTNTQSWYYGTSLTPDMDTQAATYNFIGMRHTADTYVSMGGLVGNFTKTQSINNVTIHARLWNSGAGSAITTMEVNFGAYGSSSCAGVVNTTQNTPGWVTPQVINVSGLTNGTSYEINFRLKTNLDTISSYCSAVVLTAS